MTRMTTRLRTALPAGLLALAPLTAATAPPAAAYPVIYSGAQGWHGSGHARTIYLPGSGRARPVLRLRPWHFRAVGRTVAGSATGRLVQGGHASAVSVAAFGAAARRRVRYFAHLAVYAGAATRYYRWTGRWQGGQ